ncbi:glycosyltransferase family 4 protein [Altererythrobacter sp. H2]|uniref:glycosyltransferase family 4 protein n=1 Tax=Altererythrobacter sp. H2 TaxID=3108391 RepID=UPI002B4C2419|nr:glycosyltransferase family 4 protein [Altererythrobacter sp. H2]WRK95996.1 glycosyltransferase family 4 protein [Altererythrobacter sp. H2]
MIVLLNGSYAPSLIRFRGPFIQAMIARGHSVHCTAPDVPPAVAGQLSQWGATVHELPLSRTGLGLGGQAAYFLALRRLMQRVRPDLVIGYTIKPNVFGSLAARSLGIRSVSMVTGLGFAFYDSGTFVQKQAMRLSRLLYRLATDANEQVIFQNGDDVADMVAAGCLADPGKARMVNGSGVDLAHYSSAPLPDAPVFLMIARLLVAKGVREYAAAALSLKRRYPNWRFLLVGFLDQGPDGVSAAELARCQEGGIEFLGELDDIRPAMRQASAYVLPSYREGTPRSVLEAMAMGRPVITTNAPGCRETVVQDHNGLLVPVRDAKALEAAMERLGSDGGLRSRYGAASLALAREKFAVDSVNAALMEHMGL